MHSIQHQRFPLIRHFYTTTINMHDNKNDQISRMFSFSSFKNIPLTAKENLLRKQHGQVVRRYRNITLDLLVGNSRHSYRGYGVYS